MENYKSAEKLVGLEEGVISPPIPKNFSYVRRVGSSSNKCTNWLFALLAITLLVVVSYEIWQAVRNEHFMRQIEYQNSVKPKSSEFRVLDEPTPLPVLVEASIQDMKEELKRLQNELKEVREKINEQNLTRPATEILKESSSQQSTVDTTEYDSLVPPLNEDTADDMTPFVPNSIIPKNLDSPKSVSAEEDISQDFQNPDIAVPLLVNDPVDETGGGFFWHFGIKFHDRSGVDRDSEDQNGTELKNPEAVISTETHISKGSAEESNGYINPLEKRFQIIWGWNNQGDDDHKSSESEEEARKKISSEETQTETPTPEPVDQYQEVTRDYYDDAYWGDSYEYLPESEENEDNEKLTPSPTKSVLEFPTTESSLSSTVSEDEEEVAETATTETTVTSTPEVREFSSNENVETTGFYNWGSLFGTESRFPDLDATPNNEEGTESTNTDEILGDSSSRDDTLSQEDKINKYLQLWELRLAELERLNHLYAVNEAKEEYTDDENVAESYDYEDDLLPYEPNLTTPEPEGWSYISKRSVDTAPAIESPATSLTTKELERKLSIVQQTIDQENHLIDNEVSRVPEPSKRVLQEKLNRFYAKMEAVAAHIDRLHERYVRLNKLDDDYISREFSSEEDMNGLQPSNN